VALAPALVIVPSLLHESLAQLFSNGASLVAPLLRGRVPLPEGELVVESLSADFSQLTPTEYRADQVIAVRTAARAASPRPELVLVVEVQLSVDARKQHSWPVYVATAAARFECPVYLLVLAPERGVARWARGPFGTASSFMLHPLVISYEEVPEHLAPEVAQRYPELAVLSSLAHPTAASAEVALKAVQDLASERRELYCDLIMKALADALGSAWEEEMLINGRPYEYQSPFARSYFAQGREQGAREGREEGAREGREEGARKGREEGAREGREQGLREAEERQLAALQGLAVELARGKLGALPEPLPAALCPPWDGARLSALILELGRATTAEQARVVLERAAR
jgi:hypothetical protein